MFKYSFHCSNEENIRFTINQMKTSDLSCGTSLFGKDLYGSGIHFKKCDESIEGFYLDQSECEEELHRGGSPIRVCFKGKFVRKNDELFFDVYIFPHAFEFLFIIVAFFLGLFIDKIVGFVIFGLVLALYIKTYMNLLNNTISIFYNIFK